MSVKLEVGKSYKTRGGNKVTIVEEKGDHLTYRFTSSDSRTYTKHGVYDKFCDPHPYDLIAEWEDEVPEVDLTKIEKPFGLLDKDTQERLKAHGGPYQVFGKCGWDDTDCAWCVNLSYRVKPKPSVEYKKTDWITSKYTGFGYEITEKFVDGKYDSYTVDMVPF